MYEILPEFSVHILTFFVLIYYGTHLLKLYCTYVHMHIYTCIHIRTYCNCNCTQYYSTCVHIRINPLCSWFHELHSSHICKYLMKYVFTVCVYGLHRMDQTHQEYSQEKPVQDL